MELAINFSEIIEEKLTLKDLKQDEVFKVYKIRWIQLLYYTSSCLAQGFLMVGFSAISLEVSQGYHFDQFYIDCCVIIFLLTYIFGNFFATSCLDKQGLGLTFFVGSFLTLFGAWFRYFCIFKEIMGVVPPLWIGTFLAGFAQPFFLNAGPKFTTVWFSAKEKGTSFALSSIGFPIGCLLGYMLPTFYFDIGMNAQQQRDAFSAYLLLQNILTTILTLPCIFLFQSQPLTPPSAEATLQTEKDAKPFLVNMKAVIKNRDFMLLFMVYNFIYGNFSVLPSILSQLTAPYGYSSDDNSVFGVILLIGGIIGTIVLGAILDKNQQYKKAVTVLCLLSLLGNFANIITLRLGMLAESGAMVLMGLSSSINIAVLPLAAELAYPVSESFTTGILFTLALFWACIQGLVSIALSEVLSPIFSVYIFIFTSSLATIASLPIKQKLKRTLAAQFV